MSRKWGVQYARKAEAFASTWYWREAAEEIIALLPDEGVVMDLGCNTGKFIEMAKAVKPKLKFVGVDPNEDALDLLRQKLPEVPVFTSQEAIPPHSVDVVVCIHALIQMNDPEREMLESLRVMRPGAQMHLLTHNRRNNLVWVIPNLFSGYTPDPTINRVFSRNELRMFLRDVGYVERSLTYCRPTPKWLGWIPLFNQHLSFVGQKPL